MREEKIVVIKNKEVAGIKNKEVVGINQKTILKSVKKSGQVIARTIRLDACIADITWTDGKYEYALTLDNNLNPLSRHQVKSNAALKGLSIDVITYLPHFHLTVQKKQTKKEKESGAPRQYISVSYKVEYILNVLYDGVDVNVGQLEENSFMIYPKYEAKPTDPIYQELDQAHQAQYSILKDVLVEVMELDLVSRF